MSEPVELKTERLLLRPFGLADVDDVFEYADDPQWSRYLDVIVPYSYVRRDAEAFVARCVLTPWSTKPAFAVVYGAKVIGGMNLNVKPAGRVAGMGYGLGRAYWGRGLVPEAALAVIDWAFEHYGLAKIYARADLRNERSWRVMQKLGMTREGVARSHRKARDGRADDVHYGLLREEWEVKERG